MAAKREGRSIAVESGAAERVQVGVKCGGASVAVVVCQCFGCTDIVFLLICS
jgi:hypothetical protein